MTDEDIQNGKPRHRSPPYPYIDLAKAIERAKQVHAKAMHFATSIPVLSDAWKYGEKSSGLWATAAALLHYGLMRDEGSGPKRKFTLTDDAIRIIKDADPQSEKRRDAVKRAALTPTIHAELYDRFGTDPAISEVLLRNYLTLDRGDEGKATFSESAANDVIRIYKDTMAYAGMTDSAILPGEQIETVDAGDTPLSDQQHATLEKPDGQKKDPATPAKQQQSKGSILMEGERILQDGILSRDATYRIIVSGRIGAREIERLIAKLELDKEILAEADETATSTTASQQPS
ncbi:hypothetical protein RFM23_27400 [Mesorhizobium abyssinicae]|uniref:DUF3102 domain-containing protein n=1 Tax=Mesorhizobium abyssinicae TaxID=1209958 RepID=A0ABU5AVQ9_9HYPH|nr:hypothetical protein [Mesorhizobium abyssinicae]MDX8541353.1 hypothetical protein [Mesorhizobium abyssinicae]